MNICDSLGGVMVNVFTLTVANSDIEPRLGQPKAYQIDMCYFSAKHTSLRNKSKGWLVGKREVSEWSDMRN